MAPPSKRPPQGRRPSQGKRPPQGKRPASARTLSAADSSTPEVDLEQTPKAKVAASAESSRTADERKAKREAARQQRIAVARRKQKAKRQKQMLISGIVVVALLGTIFYGVNKSRNEGKAAARAASAAGCTAVQEVANEGREHKPGTETPPDLYKSNPPTSGDHSGQPATWGSYNEETPAANLLHNLEHGGIVIHYKDQSDEQIDALASLVDGYADGVISNPNPKIETPIAIASWDRKQGCKTFSADAVAGYIRQYCSKAPEKVVTCRT